MNKTELVAAIAEKAEIKKVDAEKALKAFTDVVAAELKKGEKVQLVGFGTFDKFVLDGAVPYMDALSISFTVIAQILIVTCYREQWFFWFVLDGISIVTFALIGEWAMVAMYVCWFINTIYGWVEWSHAEKSIGTASSEA